MKHKVKVSIIVRTKNEEKWITSCLESIFRQKFKDYEVILVDNNSTDTTVEKAKKFNIAKVIKIDDFLPGKAINVGVRAAHGEFIVCISGHCIVVNDEWLKNLVKNFDDSKVAGVYGRQEPMSFTSDLDKRDLINTFGLDRKVQIKDSFFHNANSMIRKSIWNKIPFDEDVTNIEDRVWAKAVLEKGYKIIYEPEASVYHYHGIHHERNLPRAESIARILESLEIKKHKSPTIKGLNIIAIIPATGEIRKLNGRPLLDLAVKAAKDSKYVNEVYVSTDSEAFKKVAKQAGAKVPFLRPKHLAYHYVELSAIYRSMLEQLKAGDVNPDLVVFLQEDFPFRPLGLIDQMIESLVVGNYETVFPARPEYKACWSKEDDKFIELNKGFMPREFKDPVYISMLGLGYVTHPQLIYEEKRIGSKVGIVEVNSPVYCLEIKNKETLLMAEKIAESIGE